MLHYHRRYSTIGVVLQGKSSDTLLEKIDDKCHAARKE